MANDAMGTIDLESWICTGLPTWINLVFNLKNKVNPSRQTSTNPRLTLYLTLKTKQLVLIWKGYFSWGDILFLVAITPLFWFPTYLVYFTVGTMLSLVIHTVVLITQKKRTKTVPYAGYMSLVLIGYLFIEPHVVTLLANLKY